MLMVNQLVGFGAFSSGSAPPVTSYANTGGTGDRTATITTATSATPTGGTINNLVDGDTAQNSTGSVDFGTAAIAVGDYIRADFNGFTGNRQYIDEFRIITDATAFDYGAWEFQGSDDAAAWSTLASFTWSTTGTQTVAVSSPPPNQGYRYYQMVKVTATDAWGGKWHIEWEFKIANGT